MRRTAAVFAIGSLAMAPLHTFAQEFSPTYPVPLNTDAGYDSFPNPIVSDMTPHLATDGFGHWVAVWDYQKYTGGPFEYSDIRVARSSDNGATCSPPIPLNTNSESDSGADQFPRVATDGNGHWVAVWQSDDTLGDTIGHDKDILVSRSADNGATWTPPAALNTNASSDSGEDFEPRVITDGSGHWVAVWTSTDRLNNTIGTDEDILVARSVNNGATWSAPMALNSNAASDAGRDRRPEIATDQAGHWVTVWDSWDNLGGTIGQDWDILMARSTDNGVTWTPTAALNTDASTDINNQDDDFQPVIATDKAGNWVTVWGKSERSTPDDILVVARSTNNGATWTSPATLFPYTEEFFPSTFTTDGIGNWVIAWAARDELSEAILTEYDILFSSSTNNGTTWTSPAALNINASLDSGNDASPCVAVDANSNWITVWSSTDTLGGTIDDDADLLFTRWSWAVADLDDLYVDFDAVFNGPGTLSAPRNNLTDATLIANNNATIHIAPGSSDETFTGSLALGSGNQPMTLVKNGSGSTPVRIGAP